MAKTAAGTAHAERPRPALRETRRRFTVAYKLHVLQQADKAVSEGKGALGKLLACEGLCSSHLAQWRKQRRDGSLQQARRGRPPLSRNTLLAENGRLRRKLALLEERLRAAALRVGPPQHAGATADLAHANWLLRQRVLGLADLAREALGAPIAGPP
ncbi:MAG TPA: hypothetical protein VJ385_14045 [Fibrobacteria bacterium]|nr:hypothetical protein [Fibrobacteria bacterium]